MAGEESGAWIPASELFAELRRLAEVTTRLDERLSQNRTHEDVEALTDRVTALEQRIWRASGFAAAVGALVSIGVAVMTK
ncbi:hypothetical protein ACWCXC_15600 [Streptomyces sp. NPDC001515]